MDKDASVRKSLLDSLPEQVQWRADAIKRADDGLAKLVKMCRGYGASWGEIGKGLGVSQQAAHKRFGP